MYRLGTLDWFSRCHAIQQSPFPGAANGRNTTPGLGRLLLHLKYFIAMRQEMDIKRFTVFKWRLSASAETDGWFRRLTGNLFAGDQVTQFGEPSGSGNVHVGFPGQKG